MLRKPDSIPSTDTVIEDPVLEPFFITRSPSGGFTLYERVIKGENNTEYIKTICYPSNFNFALKKASEELLNTSGASYNLKEYIDEYRLIQERITNVIQ
jgi:hypothetical protein